MIKIKQGPRGASSHDAGLVALYLDYFSIPPQVRPVEPKVRARVRRRDQLKGGAHRRAHQQRRRHDVPLLQGMSWNSSLLLTFLLCNNFNEPKL